MTLNLKARLVQLNKVTRPLEQVASPVEHDGCLLLPQGFTWWWFHRRATSGSDQASGFGV